MNGEELGHEVTEAAGVGDLRPGHEPLAGPGVEDGNVRPLEDGVEGHVALRVLALLQKNFSKMMKKTLRKLRTQCILLCTVARR